MTRTVLRTTIRKKLGESTAVFWADTDINQWIEDAQLDITWKAKLNRTRGTFTTVASTARYDLSAILPNFLRIVDGGVWIYDSTNTKWIKLDYATKEYMDATYEDWPNTAASQPFIYMEDADESILELYPTPDTAYVGTNYCRVYYSSKPTTISADIGSPDLPIVLHPAVIDYVVATGFETRGYGDIANDHWSKYYDKIKSYLIEKNNKEDEEIVMKNVRNI
jgi:hypothetical protein